MSTTATETVTSIELAPLPPARLKSDPPTPPSPVAAGEFFDPEPPEGTTVFTPPNVRNIKLPLFAANFAVFLAGVNDAATGPLIPYLQPAYKISLLFVALVYLFNFAGWIIAALTSIHITARFGEGGGFLIGALLQLTAHIIQLTKPPFPVFAATYLIAGWGLGYQDALANTFVANVQDAHRWLGVLHAIYGVGALVSPIAATNIASRVPEHWNYFYAVPVGLAVMNVCFITAAWWGRLATSDQTAKDRAGKDLKQVLARREVWWMGMFFFLYVGTEVTAGGWVVEFLIRVRGGEPGQVGYVASGFWGGLTLGRIVLAEPTYRFGERKMVFVYLAAALVMQLLFWFVPSIIANAVVLSIMGFLIGPFFPSGISVISKLLPRELQTGGIALCATAGQSGSAAWPFLTGAVAAKKGVGVLQPILVALIVAMSFLWAGVPRVPRRSN